MVEKLEGKTEYWKSRAGKAEVKAREAWEEWGSIRSKVSGPVKVRAHKKMIETREKFDHEIRVRMREFREAHDGDSETDETGGICERDGGKPYPFELQYVDDNR